MNIKNVLIFAFKQEIEATGSEIILVKNLGIFSLKIDIDDFFEIINYFI
jgi:hypothetical protein